MSLSKEICGLPFPAFLNAQDYGFMHQVDHQESPIQNLVTDERMLDSYYVIPRHVVDTDKSIAGTIDNLISKLQNLTGYEFITAESAGDAVNFICSHEFGSDDCEEIVAHPLDIENLWLKKMNKAKIEAPSLEYYIDRVNASDTPDIVALQLTTEQKAVIKKASYCGFNCLSVVDFNYFFDVIEKLSEQIGSV